MEQRGFESEDSMDGEVLIGRVTKLTHLITIEVHVWKMIAKTWENKNSRWDARVEEL